MNEPFDLRNFPDLADPETVKFTDYQLIAHTKLLVVGAYHLWLIPFDKTRNPHYKHNDQLLYDFLYNMRASRTPSDRFAGQIEASIFTLAHTVRSKLRNINTLPMAIIQLYGVHLLDFYRLGKEPIAQEHITVELSNAILYSNLAVLMNGFLLEGSTDARKFNDTLCRNMQICLNAIESENEQIKKRAEHMTTALTLFNSTINNSLLLVSKDFKRPKE